MFKFEPDEPFYPEIKFKENGELDISGDSYMEDPYTFYLPLMIKIKEYLSNKENKKFTLNNKILYLNTSSNKCLYEIIETLKKFKEKGLNIKINWFYDPEDLDIVEEIDDIEEDLNININKYEIEE